MGSNQEGPVIGGKKYPPGFTKDMLDPYIFPRHQTQFKIFNYLVCFAIGYYMAFHHDFGPKEHVFTPVRRYKDSMVKKFFRVDPNDKEVQATRDELLKKKRKKTDISE